MSRTGARIRPWFRDPLNLIALTFLLAWGTMAVFGRPIGDYGVETDFYGDFAPAAARWMHGVPQVGSGFRGPFYYLLLGLCGSLLRNPFLAGKLLSVLASAVGLRLAGGVARRILGAPAGVVTALALASNPTFSEHAFRAASDPIFWALWAGSLLLLFVSSSDQETMGRHALSWLSAGLLAGAAWLTRYNGLALIFCGVLVAAASEGPRKERGIGLLTFLGGWTALALPWAWFLWKATGHPFWNTNYQNLAITAYAPDPSLAQQGNFMSAVGFASLGEVLVVDPARVIARLAANLVLHVRDDVAAPPLVDGGDRRAGGLALFPVATESGLGRLDRDLVRHRGMD